MKEFVSSNWTGAVVLVASMSVICVIFIPYGFPWTGLAWASLAMATAGLLARGSVRTVRQVINDVEAEPRPAIARPCKPWENME